MASEIPLNQYVPVAHLPPGHPCAVCLADECVDPVAHRVEKLVHALCEGCAKELAVSSLANRTVIKCPTCRRGMNGVTLRSGETLSLSSQEPTGPVDLAAFLQRLRATGGEPLELEDELRRAGFFNDPTPYEQLRIALTLILAAGIDSQPSRISRKKIAMFFALMLISVGAYIYFNNQYASAQNQQIDISHRRRFEYALVDDFRNNGTCLARFVQENLRRVLSDLCDRQAHLQTQSEYMNAFRLTSLICSVFFATATILSACLE